MFSRFLWAEVPNHIPAFKIRKMFYQRGKNAKVNHTHDTGDSRALCWAASPRTEDLFASRDTTHIKDYTNTVMTSTSSKLQIKALTV